MKTNHTRSLRELAPTDEVWEASLSCLCQFVRREGHSRVDVYHLEAGFRLGQWVKIQRTRRTELPQKQRDSLSQLPGWVWDDSPGTSWRDHLSALEAFARVHGHTQLPLNHCADGLRLGFWVAEQRLRYSEGEMSADGIDALERTPAWTWSSVPISIVVSQSTRPAVLTWERGYDLLRRFVSREGHATVPASHIEESIKLGQWVRDQRARRSRLQPTKVHALERLPGWTWQAWADRWHRGLAHLLAYIEREGTAFVPVSHIEDDYKLGVWVRAQRMRKAKLSAEQVDILERLPGWTWRAGKSNDEWWSTGYESLKRFAQGAGHCDVPFTGREDGFCLGRWVRLQRRKHLAGQLSSERARLLSELPGWTAVKRRKPRSLEGRKS
ncbi:MAG: helicase associated domain-containing protein [Myxococcota bacterium]|jgi:hypothetical protein|nr:helicase associated domain-containing protein [Myxococcota bacterium]